MYGALEIGVVIDINSIERSISLSSGNLVISSENTYANSLTTEICSRLNLSPELLYSVHTKVAIINSLPLFNCLTPF